MILALDCSSSVGSIALLDQSGVVREETFQAPRGRGGAVFGALEDFMREDPELEKVVAGTGPGSYNGIRTALATGWGLARSRAVPFLGISSLLGLGSGDYLAVGDARRGQFYLAQVSEGLFVEAPILYHEEELIRKLQDYGNLREGGRGELPIYVPEELKILPEAIVRRPLAACLAERASVHPPDKGIPEPMYLKAAFITKPSPDAGHPCS